MRESTVTRLRRAARGRARVHCALALLAAVTLLDTAACSPKPLPEADSPGAKLYVEKCNGCHVAYRPELLTAAMWQTMVARMEIEMRRRGIEMDAKTKSEILDYLTRNAGGH
jgi:hypothetical protein